MFKQRTPNYTITRSGRQIPLFPPVTTSTPFTMLLYNLLNNPDKDLYKIQLREILKTLVGHTLIVISVSQVEFIYIDKNITDDIQIKEHQRTQNIILIKCENDCEVHVNQDTGYILSCKLHY